MATSYSDLMNSEYSFPHDSEAKLLSSSLGGAQTTIAALENNEAPTDLDMFYAANDPSMTDTAMLMQNGQVGMNKDMIVASQYVQGSQHPQPPVASFHNLGTTAYDHATTAPVVKSQAGLPGPDGGFYMQPATAGLGLSFPQDQSHLVANTTYPFLQQDPTVMNDYRLGYPQQGGGDDMMMAVAATSTANCFPQPDAVPPGMVSPSSMVGGGQSENSNPAPMMTLLMGENPSIEHKMARRQSSTNLTDQQARAGKGLSRRPMPRRHTVSTPYQDGGGNASKIVKQDHTEPTTDARLRKLLRSKKHRSLGRLDMSNLDARAWMSPDTATPSPTSLCSPILPGHAAILDHERQAWVNQQQQQSRPHDYFEWDHVVKSQAPPQADGSVTPTTTAANGEDERAHCLWKGCDLVVANLESLIAHVKQVHIGSGKALYFCEWKDCPRNQKPFSKRHKMHNHLRTHTGERPFECTEPGCNKRFSRPDSLTTHLKIHSNVRPYLCEYEKCGKAYYHLRSLRKHERSHETSTDDRSTTAANQDDHRAATLAALSGDSVAEWPM